MNWKPNFKGKLSLNLTFCWQALNKMWNDWIEMLIPSVSDGPFWAFQIWRFDPLVLDFLCLFLNRFSEASMFKEESFTRLLHQNPNFQGTWLKFELFAILIQKPSRYKINMWHWNGLALALCVETVILSKCAQIKAMHWLFLFESLIFDTWF